MNTLTKKIWSELLKIQVVKNLYTKSANYVIRNNQKIKKITEHHVSKYSLTLMQFIKMFIKSILFSRHIYNKNKSLLVTTNRKLFINFEQINKKNVVINGIKYHIEKSPFFFLVVPANIFFQKK